MTEFKLTDKFIISGNQLKLLLIEAEHTPFSTEIVETVLKNKIKNEES